MSIQRLLKGKLGYYQNSIFYTDITVILTASTLNWRIDGAVEQQLSLNDVVGVSVAECDSPQVSFLSLIDSGQAKIKKSFSLTPYALRLLETNDRFWLVVNAYPLQKSKLIKQPRRILKEYWFACPNFETRLQWQQAINNTLRGQPIDAQLPPRKLQILINPNSGTQQASQIFEKVRPLFTKSNLEFSVTETSSGEDTKNIVREMDLSTTDGIVIVGGDGTIHDAIAGLTSREDSDLAIKTPIGVIPGGTGNGLCKSLLEISEEVYDPINAAFLIAKGKHKPCDLAIVRQNKGKTYSFLSLAWGLISDVDIGSEKLSFLGSWRFDIYALFLICLLRTYKGKFSFIPDPNWELPKHIYNRAYRHGEWLVIEDEFIFLWAMNTAWAAHDMNVTPYAQIDDGAMDILVMRHPTSRIEVLKALLRCGKGKHLSLPHMEYYKVQSFRLEPQSDRGILVVDGEAVDYSPIQMDIMPGLAAVNCN